jgi:hypothetical protein
MRRSNRLRIPPATRDSVREQARKVSVHNVLVFDSEMRVPHRAAGPLFGRAITMGLGEDPQDRGEQRVWVVHFAPLSVMTNDLLSSPLVFACERFGFREPLQEFRRESRNLGPRIVT